LGAFAGRLAGEARAEAIAAVSAREIVTLHPIIDVALVWSLPIEVICDASSNSPFVSASFARR
jgi:hypothetical protein